MMDPLHKSWSSSPTRLAWCKDGLLWATDMLRWCWLVCLLHITSMSSSWATYSSVCSRGASLSLGSYPYPWRWLIPLLLILPFRLSLIQLCLLPSRFSNSCSFPFYFSSFLLKPMPYSSIIWIFEPASFKLGTGYYIFYCLCFCSILMVGVELICNYFPCDFYFPIF